MEFILDILPVLLKGALITISLTFFSIIFALLIGLLTALAKISNNFIFNKIAGFYISVVRGTPLIVQLMYIYFVLPEFGIKLTAFTAALIGLSLYEGAYLAEIFRAGIASTGKGQLEAAYSIGMNYSTAMRRIIIPQALRNVLPAVGNSAILLLKNSSLASVIAANELMHTGEVLAVSTFKNVAVFTTVGVIYWLLHYPLAKGVERLERSMQK